MTKRHTLRDDQWERIKDILPGQPSDVGITAKDNRLFVEAVLYRYKTGVVYQSSLATLEWVIPGLVAGQKKVYESPSLINCHQTQIMNMPC